ncbi:MAG: hypothetical protein RL159_641 [Actinomycetota bacterium]
MMKRFTIADLAAWKKAGKRWAMLTAYDSVTASVFDEAGVPVLLVGDSAGNNYLGHENTIPVTVDEMISLARAVVNGSNQALVVVADFPFGSYEKSETQALETGIRFLKEAKAHAVKLEGGVRVVEQVKALVKYGIPVMGHLGMTPQSVNAFGGFKVQGRNEQGDAILADAKALEAAGCFAIVLELVPTELAERITGALSIPTIGIGAGACDAQVLVWTDLMGLTPKPPKFARAYRDLRKEMSAGVREWLADVESGKFPSDAESFN